jgi:hypothetical protein
VTGAAPRSARRSWIDNPVDRGSEEGVVWTGPELTGATAAGVGVGEATAWGAMGGTVIIEARGRGAVVMEARGRGGPDSEPFMAASLSLTESVPVAGGGDSAEAAAGIELEVVTEGRREGSIGLPVEEFVFVIEGRRDISGEGVEALEAFIRASLSFTDNPVTGSGVVGVESVDEGTTGFVVVIDGRRELSDGTDGRRDGPDAGVTISSPSDFLLLFNAAIRSFTDAMPRNKIRPTQLCPRRSFATRRETFRDVGPEGVE